MSAMLGYRSTVRANARQEIQKREKSLFPLMWKGSLSNLRLIGVRTIIFAIIRAAIFCSVPIFHA
jgi:hypothetical protein